MKIGLHLNKAIAFASRPANWHAYALAYSAFTSALLLGALIFAGTALGSVINAFSSGNISPVIGTLASAAIAFGLWLAGLALASLLADALVIRNAARARRVKVSRVYPSLLAVSIVVIGVQVVLSSFFSAFDNVAASVADSAAGALIALSFVFAPYSAVLSGKGAWHALNASVAAFFARPFEVLVNYLVALFAALALMALGLLGFAALAFAAVSLDGAAFAFVGALALFELILTVSAVQCFQKAYWVSYYSTVFRSRP